MEGIEKEARVLLSWRVDTLWPILTSFHICQWIFSASLDVFEVIDELILSPCSEAILHPSFVLFS